MKQLFSFILIVIISSCSQTKNANKTKGNSRSGFIISSISTDKTYGLTPENPVEVGGNSKDNGPTNERNYLNMIAGPNGETTSFYRKGSCCPVKSKNGFSGYAMLDIYKVTWEGSKDTVSIYINMYDKGIMMAPVGFTIR
jgi:hypothetical protein